MPCDIHVFDKNSIPQDLKTLLVGQFTQLCQSMVTNAYGRNAVNIADVYIVAFREVELRQGRTRTEMCGFALVKNIPNAMYIDIVCSKKEHKMGRMIIKVAETLAQTNNKPLVLLSALPHVIDYYKRLGFIESDNACDTNPHIEQKGNDIDGYRMAKCLNSPHHPRTGKGKKRRIEPQGDSAQQGDPKRIERSSPRLRGRTEAQNSTQTRPRKS